MCLDFGARQVACIIDLIESAEGLQKSSPLAIVKDQYKNHIVNSFYEILRKPLSYLLAVNSYISVPTHSARTYSSLACLIGYLTDLDSVRV